MTYRPLVLILLLLIPSAAGAASASYTTPGTYSFTVPEGVTSVAVTLIGGGGGGGGAIMDGDFWSGGGGGSGGVLTQDVPVSFGQTYTITVGGGGCGGHYWRWGADYGGGCVPTQWSGGNGGTSSFGSYAATGGHGGNVAAGANYWYGLDANDSAGGSPGGVSGAYGLGAPYNCGVGAGGDNGTGYGTGSYGQGCSTAGAPMNGQSGAAFLSWTSSCVATQGSSCSVTSAANACGQTTTASGTIQCNGSCSASTPSAPANPAGYGSACTSAANACGQTNTGTVACNGSCSASTPANPAGYGSACTSAANSCGQTNTGTIGCTGSCSAAAPSDASCPVSGVCGATHYSCTTGTSGANSMGATAYTWTCTGANGGTSASCSEPNYPDLTMDPTAGSSGTVGESLSFSGVIRNAGTGSATNFPSVMQVTGADTNVPGSLYSAGTNSLAASGSATLSGSRAFSTPGTYNVRFCANKNTSWTVPVVPEENAGNNCGDWKTVTVSYPAITGSCSVSPASGTLEDTFIWTVSGVSGGNGTYTYSWSGSEGLTGSGTSVSKTYASSGAKTGSITVSSGGSSQAISCAGQATVLPRPTVTIWTEPASVDTGQTTKLFWQATDATSCTGTGFTPGGTANPPGGLATAPNTTNPTPYCISCAGAGGSAGNCTSVEVLFPDVTITASPDRIVSGGATTLHWSGTGGVKSCTVTDQGGQVIGTGVDANTSVTLTHQGTYTASCTSTGGATVTARVVVNVRTNFSEF